MPLVARATFLVLVGATFSAFFVAQRLKSSGPVITVKALSTYFSPNGDGKRDDNGFSVVLKVPDEVTVDVVTVDGDRVKRLAEGRAVRAYSPLRLNWDGSTDAGRRAPDGQYRVRVTLRDEGRSATVQQTINVDTKAPVSEVCVGFRCIAQARGQRHLPGRPRGADLHQGRLAALRHGLPPLPHRPGQAARDRPAPEHPGRLAPTRVGRADRRQAAGPRDLHRAGRGPRHRGQRRHHAGGVRGRSDQGAARASPSAGSPPVRRCAR